MTETPPPLRPRRLARLPAVAALAAGSAVLLAALEPVGRPDVAGLRVPAHRSEVVESGAVDEVLGRAYLAVPPPEAPCPDGLRRSEWRLRGDVAAAAREGDLDALRRLHERFPDHWLPGTLYALALIGRGEADRAVGVVGRVVAGRQVPERVAAALGGAAAEDDREEALGTVQLLHLHGWLLLARGRYGPELWRSQRSAILLGTALAGPGGGLPAPGCGLGPDSLSEIDLRNNLLVAYLAAPVIEGEVRELAEDLAAAADDPGPFAAVLAARESSAAPRSEGWWRAVGLAGPLAASLGASESHPRTAINLAQLALEAVPLVADGEREALLGSAESWWETARRGVVRLPAGGREPFLRILDRTTLLLGVFRGRPVAELRESEAEVEELVASLEAAWRWRLDPERWLDAATRGDPALDRALGARAAAWRRAGRLDLALALAASDGDTAAAEALLTDDDPRPPELAEIRARSANGSSRAALALRVAAAALAAWGLGVLGLGLAAPAFDLRASAYRLEARRRLEERLR